MINPCLRAIKGSLGLSGSVGKNSGNAILGILIIIPIGRNQKSFVRAECIFKKTLNSENIVIAKLLFTENA